MGRKLLKISYLGTAYCGWQVQPNGVTVQYVLQNALEKMLGERPNVTGCSRTDSGVHAREFYCHFDSDCQISGEKFCLGLNTFLPDDISALECFDVPEDFHARYNATGKTYIYKMYYSKLKNPFLSGRSLRIKRDLDLKKAKEYCSLLVGEHNFEAFSSVHRSVTDTVRTVYNCDINLTENEYVFSVTANGFLYNTVRIMVGSLLSYSTGKITKQDVLNAFATGERNLLGATAPPEGLYLEKVHYGDDFNLGGGKIG